MAGKRQFKKQVMKPVTTVASSIENTSTENASTEYTSTENASTESTATDCTDKCTDGVQPTTESTTQTAVCTGNIETSFYVEYADKQVSQSEMIQNVTQIWETENPTEDLKSINLYVKPEENSIYYVINDIHTGRIDF